VVDQLKQAKLVGDFSSNRSQTIEAANALPKPVSPKLSLTLAIALLAGCALGTGAAVVCDLLDTRIRSLEEMRKVLHIPLLGQIPALPETTTPRVASTGLLCHATPRSPWAEAYKVASPHSAEGKSTVASNLAICLAQAGRRVLLVDADLRRPGQHKVHGLQRERGLVHILRDLMPFSRVVQPTAVKHLDLITSGPEATNPAELLSSTYLHDFLAKAREAYDTVIIDSSSLLEVADPSILGAVADAILLVVRASETKRDEASRAMEILKGLGTPILGAVANGVGAEATTRARLSPEADSRRSDLDACEIRPDPRLSFAFRGTNGATAPSRRNDDRADHHPAEGESR
jgi:capsular exopolysaccharide synthesis family protein